MAKFFKIKANDDKYIILNDFDNHLDLLKKYIKDLKNDLKLNKDILLIKGRLHMIGKYINNISELYNEINNEYKVKDTQETIDALDSITELE